LDLVHRNAPFYQLGCRLTDLEIQGDRTLVTLSGLKLHRVALIEIFDLNSRSETSTMKEYILAAVVWRDESKAFRSDNFLNRSGHGSFPLFNARRGYLAFE
jgi:hypothetical protein